MEAADYIEQREEWKNLYNQIHEYRMRRFGKIKSDAIIENLESKNILEIMEMYKQKNGEVK